MKRDRKLISKEIYEVAYIRGLSKQTIREIDLKLSLDGYKIKRICEALLKFTRGYTKSPSGRRYEK